MGDYGQVVPLPCRIPNEADVKRAMSRSNVVINCIGSMQETLKYSFHDAHVATSYRIAKIAKELDIKYFIQMSSVAAHVNSDSRWLRAKAESENVVRAFFPNATILRCTHVYGPEDRFLNRYASMATNLPFVPIINEGVNRLQPIFVHDVAHAVLNALAMPEAIGQTFNLGGPEVMTQSEFVEFIFKTMILPSTKRDMTLIAPLFARVMDFVPRRFRIVSTDQLAQLKYDFVVPTDPGTLTLADLHVRPHDFQPTVARCMVRHRGNRDTQRTDLPPPLDII